MNDHSRAVRELIARFRKQRSEAMEALAAELLADMEPEPDPLADYEDAFRKQFRNSGCSPTVLVVWLMSGELPEENLRRIAEAEERNR